MDNALLRLPSLDYITTIQPTFRRCLQPSLIIIPVCLTKTVTPVSSVATICGKSVVLQTWSVCAEFRVQWNSLRRPPVVIRVLPTTLYQLDVSGSTPITTYHSLHIQYLHKSSWGWTHEVRNMYNCNLSAQEKLTQWNRIVYLVGLYINNALLRWHSNCGYKEALQCCVIIGLTFLGCLTITCFYIKPDNSLYGPKHIAYCKQDTV